MAGTQVEIIKERLDILEVIGGYVELHKAGKHYKGKSPFANEKTPSFFVSPERGMYYCFSSQKGGDLFTFVQEMEGVDFKGALKILADKAGVELVPEDPKKRDARETQYALLEAATQFFFKARDAHPQTTEYVQVRGVTGETIHSWRIGYAPDEWRALRGHLHGKGFKDPDILKAGLIKETSGGKEPYDVFRDRIMFPLSDPSGRIVAFSGRTLKKDDDVPKYVNSPETELFQKSEILYGYDKAKQGIRHFDFSLIVEGQFDVVLSHQAGYTNAVAVSGTALTPHHIALLMRLSTRAVLALDADRAGIAAVKRSSAIMLARGMDVKVAQLPEGKDPADIIRDDPKEFKKIIGNAEHVIGFLLTILKENAKDERTYKLSVREELLPLVNVIPNRMDREHFEQVIAERTETTKESVHYELERLRENTPPSVDQTPSQNNEPERPATNRRRDLIIYTLGLLKTSHSIIQECAPRIQDELDSVVSKEEQKQLIEEEQSRVSKAIFENETYYEAIPPRQVKEELSHTLTELLHLSAREDLKQLRALMVEAAQKGDQEAVTKHLEETKKAQELLQKTINLDI